MKKNIDEQVSNSFCFELLYLNSIGRYDFMPFSKRHEIVSPNEQVFTGSKKSIKISFNLFKIKKNFSYITTK